MPGEPEERVDHFPDLTHQIIGAAIEVHRELGPGLMESAYEACMVFELTQGGLHVQRQVALPVRFKGHLVDAGYRLDLIVENKVIVELKSVERVEPIHGAQLYTYLRLSGLRVGLLINFNVTALKRGILRRVV